MVLTIDVIIRTLADARRSKVLFRALDSIQGQSGVAARPIVVVNGDRFDEDTLARLERRPGIRIYRLEQASTGVALVAGRKLVTAPYFAYLDDDDELIADSLLSPVQWMESHPDCDALISNGYFVKEGGALSQLTRIADHVRLGRPALSLLDDGWLVPGAFVMRTASIPIDMLDAAWSDMEWTYLAFELCARRKQLHFMDVPTMRYYDTPGSMSKRTRYHEAALNLLAEVHDDVRQDPDVRHDARNKRLRTLHDLSRRYWQDGQYARAWRCHLGSMRPPYTLDYLLYSRKLIWPFRVRGHGDSPTSSASPVDPGA